MAARMLVLQSELTTDLKVFKKDTDQESVASRLMGDSSLRHICLV